MISFTFEQKLARYARILVEVGVNIQSGDALYLQVDITDDPTTRQLVHQIVAAAYDAGARIVDINWQDPELRRIRLLHADENTLDEIAEWQTDKIATIASAGVSYLAVIASDPELLAGIDRNKIQRTTIATQKSIAPFLSQLYDKNVWSIATIPVQAWADKVFPDAPAAERLTLLWEAIFQASRVYADDPIAAWRTYSENQISRRDVLTAKHYTALHFTGSGTDLIVGLSENHIWKGGGRESETNKRSLPNIPTAEVFTAPHFQRVQGTVVATKPLSYSGTIIDEFQMTFKDGEVIDWQAQTGADALKSLFDIDEGARRLGEVALVPDSSPIAQTGLLFYQTIFDENAACHIALGRTIRESIAGGTEMSDDDFSRVGGNLSSVHVDFMIGSNETNVDGITTDGEHEAIMRNGEWAFEMSS